MTERTDTAPGRVADWPQHVRSRPECLESIEIKGSTEVDPEALRQFFQVMYPDRMDLLERHWRWWYRIGEFPQDRPPLVAVLDGKVIGHVAQIPVRLSMGGRDTFAAWGVDGGVLSPYRKYGLGSQLMEMWLQHYPICLGFCTEALFRILLKQGWSPRKTTYALQLPLRLDRHRRLQRTPYQAPLRAAGYGWNFLVRLIAMTRTAGWKRLREVSLESSRLQNWSLLRHPGQFEDPVHIPRSPDFLRWRVLDNPFRDQHRVLELPDADVAAIVRLEESGPRRRAQILTLTGAVKDAGTLHRFLGGLVTWAIDHRLDLVKLVTGDPFVLQVARRWFPRVAALRFVAFCHRAEDRELFQRSEHLWELIDYDLDFLP
jgi:hypothetical protein